MLHLKSIAISELPFKLTDFEATLLFEEFPSTVIFETIDGAPIVREWVDCNAEGSLDRYFYFETTKAILRNFLEGELSHFDFINNAVNAFVIFDDVEGSSHKYSIVTLRNLPDEYSPNPKFKFNAKDGVETDEISSKFNLDEPLQQEEHEHLSNVRNISKKRNTETLYLHLNKGKGIGFGTANTDVLAKTLLKFDKLYRESALDYILTAQRGEIQIHAKKNEKYLSLTTTEVYGSIAASYGVLLRPIAPFSNGLWGATDSENITENILNLISKSEEIETFKEEYPKHSEFTINSLKEFADEVYSNNLNVDFNWINPITDRELKQNIDFKKAVLIKENIDQLSIEENDEFKRKGKFRAVNCDTGTFTFVSTEDEKITGSFSKGLKENSVYINFVDLYTIGLRISELSFIPLIRSNSLNSYFCLILPFLNNAESICLRSELKVQIIEIPSKSPRSPSVIFNRLGTA